jgi:hypothetical protein
VKYGDGDKKGGDVNMMTRMATLITIFLITVCLGLLCPEFAFKGGDAFAQGQAPLTKEQIVERVQQIDRQLLQLEKQDLVKAYQALEAKEKAKPKEEKKPEVKK